MNLLRAFWRLGVFGATALVPISNILLYNLFRGENERRSLLVRQRWVRWLLPRLGIRLTLRGTPPDFPCLLVSNHRSYLDPFVLVHDVVCLPVSKSEVSEWPLIGYGTRISGVLFLERENPQSRKYTLNAIVRKVGEGYPVCLFPEGTTGAAPATLPFRPGGFKLAAEHRIRVVPMAIEYADPADYWLGSDTFLPHFIKRFGQKRLTVQVRYGTAIDHPDADVLLAESRRWIDDQLADMQNSMRPGAESMRN
jgi:1-acyl-sn-glycerol-3-phosphate acyltransferase